MKLLAKPSPKYFWVYCTLCTWVQIFEKDFQTGKMWNCWRSPRKIIFWFPVFYKLMIIFLTNYCEGSKFSKRIFREVKCETAGEALAKIFLVFLYFVYLMFQKLLFRQVKCETCPLSFKFVWLLSNLTWCTLQLHMFQHENSRSRNGGRGCCTGIFGCEATPSRLPFRGWTWTRWVPGGSGEYGNLCFILHLACL